MDTTPSAKASKFTKPNYYAILAKAMVGGERGANVLAKTGQKRTSGRDVHMSAFGGKANIDFASGNVCL